MNLTLAGLVGTLSSFFQIGSRTNGVRLKSVSNVLQHRDYLDSADASIKAGLIQLSGGTPGAGKVLQGDSSGNALWHTLVVADVSDLFIKTVEIDFGSTPLRSKKFTITDANVLTTSVVVAQQGAEAATGKTADENEFDILNLRCGRFSNGSFQIDADSISGPVVGKFKINYTIKGA